MTTHVHDDVCRATAVLNDAGMLPPNRPTSRFTAACPCCGRSTAIHRFGERPGECAACRFAEVEPHAREALGMRLPLYIDLDAPNNREEVNP